MKKFFAAMISLTILFFNLRVFAATGEPEILATSAILIEATTGRVIYEKNPDEQRPPASLTKMMTGILALENLKLHDKTTITSEAIAVDYSVLGLAPGDVIAIDELTAGTMSVSDNVGAYALAQAVSGNIPAFSELMNAKAKKIGCNSTHFANPHGLPGSDNHYSTARDLSKIAAYCMRNPEFRKIVGTKIKTVYWTSPSDKKIDAQNTNELLQKNYDGITGIKTGFTKAAGNCLAASATRNGIDLIAIVLNSPTENSRFDDAEKLLDYGFAKIKTVHKTKKERIERKIFVRGGKKGTVLVGAEEDLEFPVLEGEDEKLIGISYDVPKFIDAGIEPGKVVGEAVLKYDGKKVASVPIYTREEVSPGFSIASMLADIFEPVITCHPGIEKFFAA